MRSFNEYLKPLTEATNYSKEYNNLENRIMKELEATIKRRKIKSKFLDDEMAIPIFNDNYIEIVFLSKKKEWDGRLQIA